MISLGIRSDSPQAELYLYDATNRIASYSWYADRELARNLLAQIEQFLSQNDKTFDDLDAVFVFRGPGSFTGLRIGLTVANVTAYSLGIPIVGTTGETWCTDGVQQLLHGDNNHVVLPLYGADPRITKPRK